MTFGKLLMSDACSCVGSRVSPRALFALAPQMMVEILLSKHGILRWRYASSNRY
jgi:hypothetical protein